MVQELTQKSRDNIVDLSIDVIGSYLNQQYCASEFNVDGCERA